MNPKRKKRLIIIGVLVAGIGLAAGLIGYAFRQNINLYYTPTQLVNHEAPEGQRIQAGGLVVQGSLQRSPNSLAIRFTLSDLKHQVPVAYTGILPDLFREGQGVIATGRYEDGTIQAEQILAKHDEKYMPPQVKEELDQSARATSGGGKGY